MTPRTWLRSLIFSQTAARQAGRALSSHSRRMRVMLSLLSVLSLPAVAEVLADPTRPPTNWQAEPAQATTSAKPGPKLTSILVSTSRRVAVIDGVSLTEGQSANGVTVVRIGKTWVDARLHDAPLRLSLNDANVTKEPR